MFLVSSPASTNVQQGSNENTHSASPALFDDAAVGSARRGCRRCSRTVLSCRCRRRRCRMHGLHNRLSRRPSSCCCCQRAHGHTHTHVFARVVRAAAAAEVAITAIDGGFHATAIAGSVAKRLEPRTRAYRYARKCRIRSSTGCCRPSSAVQALQS